MIAAWFSLRFYDIITIKMNSENWAICLRVLFKHTWKICVTAFPKQFKYIAIFIIQKKYTCNVEYQSPLSWCICVQFSEVFGIYIKDNKSLNHYIIRCIHVSCRNFIYKDSKTRC